jgi:hypothetical protein
MSKRTIHSPAGSRLDGPDDHGIARIIIPSDSAPGTRHTLTVAYDGTAIDCTCQGHARYRAYQDSLLYTGAPLPERSDCWHMLGAADLLAHHLDPPPADPGGAALQGAQRDLDDEADAWATELRKVRHDEGLRALYGPS